MKKKPKIPSWQARLAQTHKLPPAPPADPFWADFQARARDLPRQDAATVPSAPRWGWAGTNWWPTATGRPWAAVAACAALLLALLGWWQWPAPAPAPSRAAAPASSQVLEVAARSGAFFILRDEQHQGMILWLVAEERPALNGG